MTSQIFKLLFSAQGKLHKYKTSTEQEFRTERMIVDLVCSLQKCRQQFYRLLSCNVGLGEKCFFGGTGTFFAAVLRVATGQNWKVHDTFMDSIRCEASNLPVPFFILRKCNSFIQYSFHLFMRFLRWTHGNNICLHGLFTCWTSCFQPATVEPFNNLYIFLRPPSKRFNYRPALFCYRHVPVPPGSIIT